jgi:O-acetyl-ADP-ribose deacetylase (regulator of RNase III)
MKINILQGDITEIKADAIVNAANSSLLGGGGVDGAIHRKGGKAILDACVLIRNKQGGCETGEAVVTTAGNLPAQYVIHTVGPVWNGGNKGEERLLENCYVNSLKLAVENQVKTIAFPNISTGIYGFPKDRAAAVVFKVLTHLPEAIKEQIDVVNLVCYDQENLLIYKALFSGS